mmetsp:Transcript_37853/g.90567  ORF Transcript_37853/g.90567 Transcript_37853/m.90567 type:complete len:256 (-) Transcript_37853:122-889(-)
MGALDIRRDLHQPIGRDGDEAGVSATELGHASYAVSPSERAPGLLAEGLDGPNKLVTGHEGELLLRNSVPPAQPGVMVRDGRSLNLDDHMVVLLGLWHEVHCADDEVVHPVVQRVENHILVEVLLGRVIPLDGAGGRGVALLRHERRLAVSVCVPSAVMRCVAEGPVVVRLIVVRQPREILVHRLHIGAPLVLLAARREGCFDISVVALLDGGRRYIVDLPGGSNLRRSWAGRVSARCRVCRLRRRLGLQCALPE